jgi:hypothetical protein
MIFEVYYDPVTQGFYQSDINSNIPPTAIKISDKIRWELIRGQAEGKEIHWADGQLVLQEKHLDLVDKVIRERSWRNNELARSDIELYKVQDADPSATGSVSQWRDYRKSLRDWPANPKFPSKESRPIPPDNKD